MQITSTLDKALLTITYVRSVTNRCLLTVKIYLFIYLC
jgi:hypothetical protein